MSEKVWVIGDGRSGTTWLANLINYDTRFQYIFEPFHPGRNPEVGSIELFAYRREEQQDYELERFFNKVFSGQVFPPDSTVSTRCSNSPDRILVKDIFANLIAKWVQHRIAGLKIVILLRHPFAVALSKRNHMNWTWMREPADFLTRQDLYNDFLQPFGDVIRSAESYFDKQVVIWAIIHHVMFDQLDEDDFHLIFYENICRQPREELSRLMQFLGHGNNSVERALNIIGNVSKFSSEEALRSRGRENYAMWLEQISDEEYKRGCRILKVFNMGKLYSGNPEPGVDVKYARKKIDGTRE
jgi:hypothetical protein